jgi:hypothetical protein
MVLGLGSAAKEMHKGSRGPLSLRGQKLLREDGVSWSSDLWRTLSIVALW